ncbi:ATPase family associated with various cellular activities (AAA) [Carpediemonas membranifera]|uniref:ATPase family associated with various cellular activities (AAA) n=1 Tax=Carpediemonas membranifera TaxID=201153 RepID=A0A8J6EB38_9EUKA|nr:ATPase family associated with various cellular activities (AAA) [Carpediemonas membranifera]|eukprot:KAG9396160.1 ATPase family associated with various cellular activities (AAA) [Carpediemonas membranifera]
MAMRSATEGVGAEEQGFRDEAVAHYIQMIQCSNELFRQAKNPFIEDETREMIKKLLRYYPMCWDRLKILKTQQNVKVPAREDLPKYLAVDRITAALERSTKPPTLQPPTPTARSRSAERAKPHSSIPSHIVPKKIERSRTPTARLESSTPTAPRTPSRTQPRTPSRTPSRTSSTRTPISRRPRATHGPHTPRAGHTNKQHSRGQGKTDKDDYEGLVKKIEAHPEASKIDKALRETILSECVSTSLNVTFDDIAGLSDVKNALNELIVLPALKPEFFTGLRAPPKGLLVYGPPGNGKTMIAKALASETDAVFFSISASSLVSKFVGESEKLMRALFTVAHALQPAIIFIDEIDSILSARSSNEHEASRRLKTEFLVRMDGVVAGDEDRVVVLAATNRPMELDDAVLRRFPKRLLIPLPDAEGREAMLNTMLRKQKHGLSPVDIKAVARAAANYSGSDLASLAREAAFFPVREVPAAQLRELDVGDLRPMNRNDFERAMSAVRPSTTPKLMEQLREWTKEYGAIAM